MTIGGLGRAVFTAWKVISMSEPWAYRNYWYCQLIILIGLQWLEFFKIKIGEGWAKNFR